MTTTEQSESTNRAEYPLLGTWTPRRLAIVGALVTLAVVLAIRAATPEAAPGPIVQWSSVTVEVSEDAGTIQIVAVLSEPSTQPVVIDFVVDGTASSPADYRLNARNLRIPAGELSASLSAVIVADGEFGEGLESIILRIEEATNASIGADTELTVLIDDPLTPPTTSIVTTSTTESSPSGTTPVTPTGGPIDVGTVATGSTRDVASVPLSFETTPGSLVLLLVSSTTSDVPAPLPVLTSNQAPWELVATSTRNGGPRRVSVFRIVPSEVVTETTVGFGFSQGFASWIVLAVDGVPLGGNGAAAIVQTATAAAAAFEDKAVVTLEPLRSPTATALGVVLAGTSGIAAGPGLDLAATAPGRPEMIALLGSTPTLETSSWSDRAHWIAIAIELAD